MNNIQNFPQRQSQRFVALYLGLAGFSTNFCMYAFRKPFTAADFQDITLWGIDLVYALSIAPKPTEIDQKERSVRLPMNSTARWDFLKKYGFGLISLIIVYVLMTILRDIRDNFGVEIWREMGVVDASIFTKTESLIGLVICILTALMYFVKDHKTAFLLNHLMIFVGCLLILFSTISFQNHSINSFGWSVFLGIGLYMAYVPYNGMLFDRLLSVLKEKANVGFLFYLADFSGYLATVFILFYQNFGTQKTSWLRFLTDLSQILPLICIISITISFFYFNHKLKTKVKFHLKNMNKVQEQNL